MLIPFLCHSSPGFEQRHCVHWTVETYRLVIRCYAIDSDLGGFFDYLVQIRQTCVKVNW